jgi:hypothetical protein
MKKLIVALIICFPLSAQITITWSDNAGDTSPQPGVVGLGYNRLYPGSIVTASESGNALFSNCGGDSGACFSQSGNFPSGMQSPMPFVECTFTGGISFCTWNPTGPPNGCGSSSFPSGNYPNSPCDPANEPINNTFTVTVCDNGTPSDCSGNLGTQSFTIPIYWQPCQGYPGETCPSASLPSFTQLNEQPNPGPNGSINYVVASIASPCPSGTTCPGGINFTRGDTLSLVGGNNDAVITVTAVQNTPNSGSILAWTITGTGSGYTQGTYGVACIVCANPSATGAYFDLNNSNYQNLAQIAAVNNVVPRGNIYPVLGGQLFPSLDSAYAAIVCGPPSAPTSPTCSSIWESLIDKLCQWNGTECTLGNEVDVQISLDEIYQNPSGDYVNLLKSTIAYARARGMYFSWNPEFTGPIGQDCNTILSGRTDHFYGPNYSFNSNKTPYCNFGSLNPPNCQPSGPYDWYNCLTTPLPNRSGGHGSSTNLNGFSIWQWIIVNLVGPGDRIVPLHEPTTMMARFPSPENSAPTCEPGLNNGILNATYQGSAITGSAATCNVSSFNAVGAGGLATGTLALPAATGANITITYSGYGYGTNSLASPTTAVLSGSDGRCTGTVAVNSNLNTARSCADDWISNFVYGCVAGHPEVPCTGADGKNNPSGGGNNIIEYVAACVTGGTPVDVNLVQKSCASPWPSGYSPFGLCERGGSPPNCVHIGNSTAQTEAKALTAQWVDKFAAGIDPFVETANDIYAFDAVGMAASTRVSSCSRGDNSTDTPFPCLQPTGCPPANCQTQWPRGAHKFYVEEFGIQPRWIQSGISGSSEGNAIIGLSSCQWYAPISNITQNFLSPFLSWAQSQNAQSVAMFATQAFGSCLPTFPDNPSSDPETYNTEAQFILNGQLSPVVPTLKSIITYWPSSAQSSGAKTTGVARTQ